MVKSLKTKWIAIGVTLILPAIYFIIGAVAETEIQAIWEEVLKDFFTKSVNVNFRFPVWIFLLLTLIFCSLLFVYINYPRRRMKGRLSAQYARKPIAAPDGKYENAEIVRAVVKCREGIIQPEEFAEIIEAAVNTNALRPEVGTGYLQQYNYYLVLYSDGRYKAVRNGQE